MDREVIQDAVFQLMAEKLCVQGTKITLDQSVNFDLGMDGDDAVEFFQELGERFQIDLIPLDEEWEKYFLPEGVAFFGTSEILTLCSPQGRGLQQRFLCRCLASSMP